VYDASTPDWKNIVPLQKIEQKSQITVLLQTDEKFCQGKLEVPAKSKRQERKHKNEGSTNNH